MKRATCLCLAALFLAGCGRWDYHSGYRWGANNAREGYGRNLCVPQDRSPEWYEGHEAGFADEMKKAGT